MITIALIDQQPIVRVGLNYVLKNEFVDVTLLESDSVKNFHSTYANQRLDLIILGAYNNDSDSKRDYFRELKKWYPAGLVIINGGDTTRISNILSHFKTGALKGFISKKTEITELLLCIKQVLGGKHYLSNDILVDYVRNKAPFVDPLDPSLIHKLSTRESQVAHYLIEGMSTTNIAKTLNIKPSTISTMKKNIFKKLNITNVVQLSKVLN